MGPWITPYSKIYLKYNFLGNGDSNYETSDVIPLCVDMYCALPYTDQSIVIDSFVAG